MFYTIWTRKEAYAKALGRGVGMPFSSFSVVDVEPGQPPAFTAPPGAVLHHRAAGAGYAGAVAALGSSPPMPEFFAYPPTGPPT